MMRRCAGCSPLTTHCPAHRWMLWSPTAAQKYADAPRRWRSRRPLRALPGLSGRPRLLRGRDTASRAAAGSARLSPVAPPGADLAAGGGGLCDLGPLCDRRRALVVRPDTAGRADPARRSADRRAVVLPRRPEGIAVGT